MNGKNKESNKIFDADQSPVFWSSIWNKSKEHKQECLFITKEIVSKQSRKVPHWKTPERDGVQGFWIKKLTSLHERTAFQLNKILNGNEQLPKWLTYGRIFLC